MTALTEPEARQLTQRVGGMATVPLQVITQAEVRASIRRAKASLEKAAEEIVWQIEVEAWRTLEPRTTGDTLTLHGYVAGNALATAANVYAGWTSGQYRHAMQQSSPSLTKAEALALIEDTPELVDAARFATLMRSSLPLAQGALATAQVLFARIDGDDCADFFDRIRDLRSAGKGDPIATLIRRTTEMRSQVRRVLPSTSLFLLFRAWNACRAGESLDKFQFGSQLRGWTAIPEPK